MVIKELKYDESNPDNGIFAVSFVENPAIETPFEYFAQGKLDFFKYTAEPDPEVIATSHEWCKKHAGKVYHISEINQWGREDKKVYKFVEESDFFATFTGKGNSNIDQQIYNCRHYFERVSSIKEVPPEKRYLMSKETFIELAIENEEKRIVKGLILKSGQLIYRNNADGQGNSGYVWLGRDTIKKLKDKYGYNRSITFKHLQDITGTCILLDSFLEEDTKEVKWYMTYKVLSEKLWNVIKSKQVIGFSIEGLFTL